MKRLTERAIHYATLGVITVAAVWVMWRMSARGGQAGDKDAEVRLLAPVAAPKSLVAVERLEIEPLEIYATFSGRIQPWETYQVGFEIAGRVQELGEDGHGRPLDVGDQVEKGQILAVLDDRTLRAYRSEAAAQVEQATSDLDRAESARRKNPTAITESDLQRYVTDLALANARLEVAAKNLEDSVLRSPVAATIAKRLAKPGESIGANQIVFELVENDKVLLVLNVPEAEVRGLEARMRQVRRERDGSGSLPLDFAGRSDIFLPTPDATLPSPDSAEGVFRAHVQLEGKDVYGRPWPKLEGNVYQIAEVADAVTSLFEVEVALPNEKGFLRPGMIATAQLVTAQVDGYKIPAMSVIYRKNRAYVFSIAEEPCHMELLYWDLGPFTLRRAKRVDLMEWVDQGEHVLAPAGSADLSTVVTRGQHRLADGQLVRIADSAILSPGVTATASTSRANLGAAQ